MIHSTIEAFHFPAAAAIDDTPKFPSVMPEIIDRIRDVNSPVGEIAHLITYEIARTIVVMQSSIARCGPRSQMNSYMRQIRALQALFGQLVESHTRARCDELNLDGPKFTFVFGEIVNCFTEALEKTIRKPEKDFLNKTIMMQFRDCLAQRDEDIRRKLAKM